ncbi:RluA family pseudouridine synthase [Papillibacter cinnamivorans]|uniref:RNA pseudouridylate synthase n=1 Tax=Papillibacter cinnamivorans DSM 12816 TaxID=1122930 RepID=A0A1W1YM70_9FIRM|nr:RluA family pseudouridine synthase [Papillibacter cinnamivorans]SMC37244.1 23S rRNA pseudouridine955/2504/2580 synthase [Papillibacter cinnamivorans DSM 12816]
MREFTAGKNDAERRLDRFCLQAAPRLPSGLAQKYIRLGRIKVNGRPARGDTRLAEGDRVQMYLNDELFETPGAEEAWRRVKEPRLSVLYEDDNILLADKKPGVSVHADEEETVNTLISHIQAYLYHKGEWDPAKENSFSPALCNRIDRNTGGIVIAAKNAPALRILNEKIRDREILKFYLCIIHGSMEPQEGTLEGFLLKDEGKKQVTVRRAPFPGARKAITRYRTLKTEGGLSLLECELVTGRTHQIRAQFAAEGHPLLGDGKYGIQAKDRPYGRKYQALYSYKLAFAFRSDAGILNYLKGAFFRVQDVDFVKEYFTTGTGK